MAQTDAAMHAGPLTASLRTASQSPCPVIRARACPATNTIPAMRSAARLITKTALMVCRSFCISTLP